MKTLKQLFHHPISRLGLEEKEDIKFDFATDVIVALGLERSYPVKPFGDEIYPHGVGNFIDMIEDIARGKQAHVQLESDAANGEESAQILREALSGLASDKAK